MKDKAKTIAIIAAVTAYLEREQQAKAAMSVSKSFLK
jgi:hypothetical protein